MSLELNRSINKTGAIVKVYTSKSFNQTYELGITMVIQKELFIIFLKGNFIQIDDLQDPNIEYICATYLAGDIINSKTEMLSLFKEGRFDLVFNSFH